MRALPNWSAPSPRRATRPGWPGLHVGNEGCAIFVTDAAVEAYIAPILKKVDATTLTTAGPYWPALVSGKHLDAYNDIFQALVARGYTSAQIVAWDAGITYELNITAYYCLVGNAVLSEAGKDFIDKGERYLESLKSVTLTVAGATIDPLGTAGQVGHGDIAHERHRHFPGDRGHWGECWGIRED